MTLYTLRYNNYYNRIKKGFNTINKYNSFIVDSFQDINFNPNDNISTEQILNISDTNIDYLIVVNDYNEIVSRWYIMEATRLREGQWKLQLLRDVVQDYKDVVLNSPMMIQRGWCSNGDRAIFNNENIATSKIKSKEILLKDTSKCAWLVGYMANPKVEDQDLSITYGLAEPEADITVSTFDDWQYSEYAYFPEKGQTKEDTEGFSYTEIDNYGFLLHNGGTITSGDTQLIFDEDGYVKESGTNFTGPYWAVDTFSEVSEVKEAIQATSRDALVEAIDVYYGDSIEYAKSQAIKKLKDKIIYIEDEETYYQVSLRTEWEESGQTGSFKPDNNTNPVVSAFKEYIEAVNTTAGDIMYTRSSYDDEYQYFVHFGQTTTRKIQLTKVSVTAGTKSFTIPKTVKTLKDSPYRMFCMPYADDYAINYTGGTKYTSALNTLSIATAIMSETGANVYDIQLLPYCPIANLRRTRMACSLGDWIPDVDYVFIEDVPTILFFSETSKGTFDITYEFKGVTGGNIIETKADSLTKMLRLCSPNYQGAFEFSPTKNYGVSKINVDFHYKPYQPYIHLNPDFWPTGLYGGDFDDARGLICGGDFSITRVDDAWTQYELQNKNYNTIFDKNIQKLETEQKYARISDVANIVAGSLGAGGNVASVASVGGPVAAGIAGVAGAAVSAGAGIVDYQINEALRELNKQHTIDIWELNLDNIKAIPYSLSKVSAFNTNNKIWPFIEVYLATTEEYAAVYDYIKYRGMRLDRIGKIKDMLTYIPTFIDYGFIQGDFIRLEGLQDDTHVATVISNELRQGVYL